MKLPSSMLLLCLAFGCLGLVACGQKGPLYLPSEPPAQGGDQPPATETPADPS